MRVHPRHADFGTRRQLPHQPVQRPQPGTVQHRPQARLDDTQHIGGIAADRSRRTVGQIDHQQQHAVPPLERLRRQQPTEQRVRLGHHPHLTRQDRTQLLQSVAFTPGTGKSQTISNLISTLVARGKRVLFVAEKRAAIDAVLRRLNHVGLGDLVLDLHGGVSSKRKVAEALNEALMRNGSLAKPKVDGVHRNLVQRRNQLNEHAAALHEERAPWQISFFAAQAELLALPGSATTDIRFRGPVLERLGADELAHATETLMDYVGRGGLQLRYSGSPWARATVVSEEEAHTCRVEVETLRRHVPEVLANFDRAAAETGLRTPGTLEGWSERIQLWQRVEDLYETFDRPSMTYL